MIESQPIDNLNQ